MAKSKALRIAVGNEDELHSGVWRIIAKKGDVYLGRSKEEMGIFKFSLHESGLWIFAATSQSGVSLNNGNRRAKQWIRPPEFTEGVTRGPSILVPFTSLGSRKILPSDATREICWYPAPEKGEFVEFSLYFVRQIIHTKWSDDQTVIGKFKLNNGCQLVILACKHVEKDQFSKVVEKLLHDNVFRVKNLADVVDGRILWLTESPDQKKIPLFIDLPMPI